jgi:hypothetical protein
MIKTILIVIMALLAADIGLSLLYICTGIGKWFYHDRLDWHMPNGKYGFTGVSLTSHCKYCGKEIMQDSQGNWF